MSRITIAGTANSDWLHLQNAASAMEALLGAGDDGAFGSLFNDVLQGGDGNDMLWGEAGADTLIGGTGNDMLQGGEGNDRLDGGTGDDRLWGGTGDDLMLLGPGNDQAWGEAGNDTIVTGEGNDSAYGGEGADSIDAGTGDDSLQGDAGNDTLLAGEGRNTVVGGEGDDVIQAGAGNDSLTGDAGNDIIQAGNGHNTVWAGQGDDSVTAGTGNDTIAADEGRDTILAGAGDDVVWGNGGDDVIDLGAGNDSATGDMGADTILGGEGNDSLYGGEGDDRISAGAGADRVNADGGNDLVTMTVGAARGDVYDGGAGFDTLGFELTRAEWLNAGFQADLARFLVHAGSTPWADFRFAPQNLTVRSFEAAAVTVDGAALSATDDAVIAAADSFTVGEDAALLSGNVTANDSIADLLAAVALTAPASAGSLVLGADGAFTWDGGAGFQALAAGETRLVTFAYRATDADGDHAGATVSITVLGANDAATIGGTARGAVAEDGLLATGGRLTIADADAGQAAFAAPLALDGKYGRFTFDAATGDWGYRLDNAAAAVQGLAAGQTVTDRLAVASLDGSATAEIAVSIAGRNDLGPNLLINGGFEAPALPSGTWAPRSDVPGWTNSAGPMEIWAAFSVASPEGRQHLEIDHASGLDRVSQSLDVTAGHDYLLSFEARARRAGMATSEAFEVLWNGQKLAEVNPSASGWTTYSYTVTGAAGLDTLTFAELAAGNDSFGGMLDNVQLRDTVW
jgi:VCBS repeat-containing protein